MRKNKYSIMIIAAIIATVGLYLLHRYNYIPHTKYTDADFGIVTYKSPSDRDNDGIDDQTDILQSAHEYLATEPKYKSKYYGDTGYPDDGYGVCTDVVAFALKGAGYDLMELVNKDIRENPDSYDVEEADIYIDFRRVKNLLVYFKQNAEALTADVDEISEWQAGDIVIWDGHIGIVSDHRNKDGVPFVLHNANPVQASYEEDILGTWGEILGHYRISGKENTK